MAIVSIRHRGLRGLFEEGSTRGVPVQQAQKLENMLHAIDQAQTIEEIEVFPGWRLDPLAGNLDGYWSLTVTGNLRLIFRFSDGEAEDLDLIDYH